MTNIIIAAIAGLGLILTARLFESHFSGNFIESMVVFILYFCVLIFIELKDLKKVEINDNETII